MEDKDQLWVAAALICDGKKFLAARRPEGKKFAGQWELPGGKLLPSEEPRDCVLREIQEELSCKIDIDRYLLTCNYKYDDYYLCMYIYLCHLCEGEKAIPNEGQEIRWIGVEDIDTLDWVKADYQFLDYIKNLLK